MSQRCSAIHQVLDQCKRAVQGTAGVEVLEGQERRLTCSTRGLQLDAQYVRQVACSMNVAPPSVSDVLAVCSGSYATSFSHYASHALAVKLVSMQKNAFPCR